MVGHGRWILDHSRSEGGTDLILSLLVLVRKPFCVPLLYQGLLKPHLNVGDIPDQPPKALMITWETGHSPGVKGERKITVKTHDSCHQRGGADVDKAGSGLLLSWCYNHITSATPWFGSTRRLQIRSTVCLWTPSHLPLSSPPGLRSPHPGCSSSPGGGC
jgi:hypothetical protein